MKSAGSIVVLVAGVAITTAGTVCGLASVVLR